MQVDEVNTVFREIWPDLCSEGQTYDSAFAAAPYLAELASREERSRAREYVIVLGLIETCRGEVPLDLAPGYGWAVDTGLRLCLEALSGCPPHGDLRYLLAAVAAFRGRTDLAAALQDLDAIQEPCGSCGEVVFPTELQRIVETDRSLDRAGG